MATPAPTPKDKLNRAAVEALMRAKGIDGYAHLARRMSSASEDRSFERSYVSRVLRNERPAQPSFIVACARALGEPTLAITGEGVTITDEDIDDEAAA